MIDRSYSAMPICPPCPAYPSRTRITTQRLSWCIGALLTVPALASAQTDNTVVTYGEALDMTTTNGAIIGEAILRTCGTKENEQGTPRNQAFQRDCNILVNGSAEDTAGSAAALEQLAADQINAQNAAATRAAGVGVATVQSRLQRIRLAELPAVDGSLIAASGLLQPAAGGGASADLAAGPFGGFLNYEYVSANEDQTDFQPGFDVSRWSLMGGMDYRFSDSFVGGLSVRYADDDVDFDRNRGEMTGESWGLIAYASYFLPNGVFIDGSLGYTNTSYSLERRINYNVAGNQANQIAESDPDADVWNVSLGAGYDLYLDAWTVTPALRLNYVKNDVDAYRERMSDPNGIGGSMALAVDSQSYESLTSNLGVQLSRAISLESGVLLPQLRLSWVHEFENGQERVGATMVDDINQQPLYILTTEPDENYFEVGVGVSGQFANGRSAFIAYNTILGYDDLDYHAISAGVRLEF